MLRDGAAAQYGSDAIAGVMNFELKNARSGGSMEFRTGRYFDGNDGDPATCGAVGRSCNGIGGNAPGFTFAGNTGLPLGPEGFLNLSLEYGGTQPTNRAVNDGGTQAVIDGGNTFVRDTSRVWGSPLIEDDLKLFANFGTGGDRAEFYGHANYASKTVTGGFYYRNPNNRGNVYSVDGGQTLLVGDVLAAQGMGSANCPTVNITNGTPDPAAFAQVRNNPNCFTFHQPFLGAPDGLPGGFTPQFGGDVYDYSLVSGVRGTTMTGLNWDISGSTGRNHVQTFIYDTVNASLGPDSPTSFEPNLLQQTETSLNADMSYAASDMINVAGGLEWRNEQYHLGQGDPASWAIGPYGAQGFSSASNGYNGTRPENAGTWDRANVAGYGDIEIHGVDNEWNLGAAVRIEDFYDSFGTTMNSKLSGRYGFTDTFAMRAAVSSGFRAPTPGQQNVLNVTTEFDYEIQDLVNNGTIPSTSPVAALRGGVPLQPEESINYSLGSVVDTGPFTFTADFFRINVSDRLTISRNYTLSPVEVETLLAEGFAEAGNLAVFRFFVNDFSTRSAGARRGRHLDPARDRGTDDVQRHLQLHRHRGHCLQPREYRRRPDRGADPGAAEVALEHRGQPRRRPLGPDGPPALLRLLLGPRRCAQPSGGGPIRTCIRCIPASRWSTSRSASRSTTPRSRSAPRTSSTRTRTRIRTRLTAWVTATASSGRSASTAATTTPASASAGARRARIEGSYRSDLLRGCGNARGLHPARNVSIRGGGGGPSAASGPRGIGRCGSSRTKSDGVFAAARLGRPPPDRAAGGTARCGDSRARGRARKGASADGAGAPRARCRPPVARRGGAGPGGGPRPGRGGLRHRHRHHRPRAARRHRRGARRLRRPGPDHCHRRCRRLHHRRP